METTTERGAERGEQRPQGGTVGVSAKRACTNLDNAALGARAHEQNVGGLEVAVKDPVGVHVRDAVQDLPDDGLDHVARQVVVLIAVHLQDLLRAHQRVGETLAIRHRANACPARCVDSRSVLARIPARVTGVTVTYKKVVLSIVKDERDGALDWVEDDFFERHNVFVAQLAAKLWRRGRVGGGRVRGTAQDAGARRRRLTLISRQADCDSPSESGVDLNCLMAYSLRSSLCRGAH